MVPGSSSSLGKTPTLKAVIQFHGLQWPAWKTYLYHNSRMYKPVKLWDLSAWASVSGCWHGIHTTYRTPHSTTWFNSWCKICQTQSNKIMRLLCLSFLKIIPIYSLFFSLINTMFFDWNVYFLFYLPSYSNPYFYNIHCNFKMLWMEL